MAIQLYLYVFWSYTSVVEHLEFLTFLFMFYLTLCLENCPYTACKPYIVSEQHHYHLSIYVQNTCGIKYKFYPCHVITIVVFLTFFVVQRNSNYVNLKSIQLYQDLQIVLNLVLNLVSLGSCFSIQIM